VKRLAFALYRILENPGNVMVDAGTWKKLDSFAIDFAFQGFQQLLIHLKLPASARSR
jgi:hypothetical protein